MKKRSAEREKEFEATIPQLRNKFKKCVGKCKKAALTITTETEIKIFQDSKGYGKWFNQLFQLVKSRDSCQPEQAVEPSAHVNESDPILEDDSNKTATSNQFIPLKRKKPKKEDILKSTHDLIKETLESDKTDMLEFVKKKFKQSRHRELKLFQMFF